MKLPERSPPIACDPSKKFIIQDGKHVKVDRTPQEDRYYTEIVNYTLRNEYAWLNYNN